MTDEQEYEVIWTVFQKTIDGKGPAVVDPMPLIASARAAYLMNNLTCFGSALGIIDRRRTADMKRLQDSVTIQYDTGLGTCVGTAMLLPDYYERWSAVIPLVWPTGRSAVELLANTRALKKQWGMQTGVETVEEAMEFIADFTAPHGSLEDDICLYYWELFDPQNTTQVTPHLLGKHGTAEFLEFRNLELLTQASPFSDVARLDSAAAFIIAAEAEQVLASAL